jgi:hypothetical protein
MACDAKSLHGQCSTVIDLVLVHGEVNQRCEEQVLRHRVLVCLVALRHQGAGLPVRGSSQSEAKWQQVRMCMACKQLAPRTSKVPPAAIFEGGRPNTVIGHNDGDDMEPQVDCMHQLMSTDLPEKASEGVTSQRY